MTAEDHERPVVLVIDDDAGVRDLYVAALRRAGFKPVAASDGVEGLEIIGSRDLDLVVCDVAMPRMSGLEVVRALRAEPETATLPIILITGSGDDDSLVDGLAAGADDFLAKPVRLDELVARARAHVRTQSAWLGVVEHELRSRVSVVAALARLRLSADPEEDARRVVAELAQRSDTGFAAVFQVLPHNRGRLLATNLDAESSRALEPTSPRMRSLIERARSGPWAEVLGAPDLDESTNPFWGADLDVAAGAPIFWGDQLVGILTIGRRRDLGRRTSPRDRDLYLATAIDYAAVLGAATGATLAAQSELQASAARLRRILTNREFETAFQPIVNLATGTVTGFEALTRFSDGVAPNVRFAEAWSAGLGPEFEVAAVARAAEMSATLPAGAFLSINVSPEVLLGSADQLRAVLPHDRPVVVEVTEQVPIEDYVALRRSVARLGAVRLAVDDAGAGFASLRHILELEPAYAKLDMSIVRGIDDDQLRQALTAGMVYYATRSGFKLIAEGVEELPEAEILRELGVDLGQGYLFGRPGPPP
jgi:EAL domain-containing protein (putative c-di-GMP-specific phosphodiesterase class I)/DNA-binding response OmpR family regulator